MKQTLKTILFVIASIVIIFFISEWILRAIQRSNDFRLGWKYTDYDRSPKPYVMFGPNPDEYRGRSALKTKEKNEFRIFVLGGSTVFVGDPAIPELLEKRLQQLKENIRVFNYGVVSQNSTQELVRTITEVSSLSPDLILFYDGGNDIMDPFYWDPRPGYPFNFLAYENNPIFNPDLNTYPFWSLLGLGSRLIRNVFFDYYQKKFFNLEKLRSDAKYLSIDWQEKIAQIYSENHLKAFHFSRSLGIKFVGYFQPTLFYKNRLNANEVHLAAHREKAIAHALAIRNIIKKNIEKLKSENPEFLFEDISNVFNDNENVIFTDYIHPTQEGINLVSEKIYSDLKHKKLF